MRARFFADLVPYVLEQNRPGDLNCFVDECAISGCCLGALKLWSSPCSADTAGEEIRISFIWSSLGGGGGGPGDGGDFGTLISRSLSSKITNCALLLSFFSAEDVRVDFFRDLD